MKNTRNLQGFPCVASAILLLMGLFSQADARPVRSWSPNELTDKSQIVCNGVPIKVTVTDQKGQIQLLTNDPDPIRIVSATIKVLGTIKGQVGPEIEIRYPNLDYDALRAKGSEGIINGPEQIYLQAGQRYRFYLNPVPGHSWYVGALNGEFDDRFAVQELDARESDTNTPLLKNEAVKIATDYLLKQHPWFEGNFKWVIPSNSMASESLKWTVNFYPEVPQAYPAFTSAAEITVNADRSISPDSWISTGLPVTVPNSEMINKEVRVTYEVNNYEVHPRDGAAFHSGEIRIVRGTLKKIADGAITLDFAKPDEESKLTYEVISRKDIKGITPLL